MTATKQRRRASVVFGLQSANSSLAKRLNFLQLRFVTFENQQCVLVLADYPGIVSAGSVVTKELLVFDSKK